LSGNTWATPPNTLGELRRLTEFSGPDPDNFSAWVNFHSFVAKVEAQVWPGQASPTVAIWAMRDAFEQEEKYYSSSGEHEAYVLAAAQYVLCKGQDLIEHVLYPGDVSSLDEQHRAPGPRYSGTPHLDRARWRYWREGFAAEVGRATAPDEVKTVAAKVVKLMDALEDATLGLA
jgi:hypothetical protein